MVPQSNSSLRNLDLSNVSNFPSGAGWASVLVYSRSTWVRKVICATVGKKVGCGFKFGGYGFAK